MVYLGISSYSPRRNLSEKSTPSEELRNPPKITVLPTDDSPETQYFEIGMIAQITQIVFRHLAFSRWNIYEIGERIPVHATLVRQPFRRAVADSAGLQR